MLSTVRLTWCIMDTVDGAVGNNDNTQHVKDVANQSTADFTVTHTVLQHL